jgi:hypothetical protein
MTNQFTQKTVSRLRRGSLLRDVLLSNRDSVRPDLQTRVSPEYVDLLIGMKEQTAAELDRQAEIVREAALELTAEMQDDDPAREERDVAVDQLYGLAVQTRPSIESAFGVERVSVYGLAGKTPRTPSELSEFVGNAVHLMRTEPAEATNALGVSVRTEAVADVLQPALDELDGHIAQVEAERQELISAYNRRDRALANFDAVFDLAADLADRVYRLAGRDDLADQLATRLRQIDGSGDAAPTDADPDVNPTEDEEPVGA